MAALVIRQPIPRQSLTPPPQIEAEDARSNRPGSAPIPNKHIPYCPPGPVPIYHTQRGLATPPNSPPSKNFSLQTSTFLQPLQKFPRLSNDPPVYSMDASDLVATIEHVAAQTLPDPKLLFPWLHGLNIDNQMQLAFFSVRRKVQRNTPKCFRGLIIVKAGGDLSNARIKSAISADEILDIGSGSASDAQFIDMDPREGFSIRNFHIQMTKMAVMSDIVIYRDETATDDDVLELAKAFSIAQDTWRVASRGVENENSPQYHTFVLSSKSHLPENDSFTAFTYTY